MVGLGTQGYYRIPSFRIVGLMCLAFLGISEKSNSQAHQQSNTNSLTRLYEILKIIHEVPAGEALIQKALHTWDIKKWTELTSHIQWSDASRTDTVLTRNFDPETGKEDRIRFVTIYLREDQPLTDIVLDLAHELVHATSRSNFDPYDPSLTPGKYISAAIDGEGGEVQAVIRECEVGLQLSEYGGASPRRCQNYLGSKRAKQALNRDQIRREFYRVGNWYLDVIERLGDESTLFPLLTKEVPQLFSSTGHAPYPVALLREYEEITEMACKNSENRLKSVVSTEKNEVSSPKVLELQTSVSPFGKHNDVRLFVKKRCRKERI